MCRGGRNFPDHPENIRTIRKLSRLSGNFPDHPENIRTIQKLSRLSGNFPDNPENIQTIWKFSKGSGNFPVQFQGLRAKTFRTRHPATQVFAPLPRASRAGLTKYFLFENIDSVDRIAKVERGKYAFYIRLMY